MSPTIEEQFRLANKDYIDNLYGDIGTEFLIDQEQSKEEPKWAEEDENEYPFTD